VVIKALASGGPLRKAAPWRGCLNGWKLVIWREGILPPDLTAIANSPWACRAGGWLGGSAATWGASTGWAAECRQHGRTLALANSPWKARFRACSLELIFSAGNSANLPGGARRSNPAGDNHLRWGGPAAGPRTTGSAPLSPPPTERLQGWWWNWNRSENQANRPWGRQRPQPASATKAPRPTFLTRRPGPCGAWLV